MAAEMLRGSGHIVVPDQDSADANLLLTCTVIDYTERHMIARMKALVATERPLIVSGCMVTAQRATVSKVAPGAMLVAPGDLPQIISALGSELANREEGIEEVTPMSDSVDAIVPIAQGCLGRCKYCITRLARGRLRSCEPAAVLAKVRRYVDKGYKEIRLTAQDTAAYGRDMGSTLADLVGKVASIPGDFRIRVGMANPATIKEILTELIEAYSSPKVYKFLHLPVQSGDDGILEAMGRGYTVTDFKRIIHAFRFEYPDITLSTDIIVGFPGETDEQFAASLRLIEDVRPDIVNVTRFSARPMTSAAYLPGRVVGWRAKERSRRLTELRFEIARDLNSAYDGKVLNAITIEKGKRGTTLARTSNYKQVVLRGELPLGRSVRAMIDKTREVDLMGNCIGPTGVAAVCRES